VIYRTTPNTSFLPSSFPNSVWERPVLEAPFPSSRNSRETGFRKPCVPKRSLGTRKASSALLVLAVLASPWFTSAAYSGTPRDELLRLAPPDAGFCLIVQNWREQLAQLQQSPVVARLAETPYGQALKASPEAKRIADLDEHLRASLKVSWPQLRDEILGDALLLAYTPGPPGKPEAEVGLLMVHVRRPDVLAGLLDKLSAQQRKSGELVADVEVRAHRNYPYIVLHRKEGRDEFYMLRGAMLAFADKEAAIKAVIDRDWDANPVGLDLPPVAQRLRALGVSQDFAIWWVNPRAFDAAVAAKAAKATGAEAAFLRTFERYWKTLDGVAVSLALNKEVAIKLAVQAKTENLPAPVRRLLAETSRPSALWTSFPNNALFAAAGRVPWEPAAEAGGEFLTTDARKDIQDAVERTVGAVLGGRDLLAHLLRHLGPDWGVCVTPPETGEKGWLPSLTAMLRLRPAGDGGPPVEQRVLDGLDFAARLAVLSCNTQRAGLLRLRLESQDGVEVRVIEGSPLPGLQPAFAWKGGYLVLASTPEAVRRFVPPTKAPVGDGPPDAEVPLVRLALQGWAGYLKAYRGPVTAYIAGAYQLSRDEADGRVERLVKGLELFDAVEVVQRTAPGRAVISIRLKTLPAEEKPH
jgi:hypothetical protein